ncbi:exo-1,3-beta-glucanase [Fragilariopsis cylindrus CCMP1102]|uniref:Exo-1,3-beta-glucanase n=1 Tax=Fragilariopsis cylindrus CCMP1102 TaxID=635003 RepID=A0A1E7EIS1_9STRA|nr:exo-1,3-beta-glucanase [Fragilariopsis cylindrus CCMP1102]|eukprot:OEU05796.1 exo-1,3-beta-glucanase [Fragilariopsis cylindrus CCMP1102]
MKMMIMKKNSSSTRSTRCILSSFLWWTTILTFVFAFVVDVAQAAADDDKVDIDDAVVVDDDDEEIIATINGTQYPHFIAHNESWTCTNDKRSTKFNEAVRGVNLGSYMVLEPWITPSLFYQFLGKSEIEGVAMDSYSFCEVLGGKEANRHCIIMETWVTEDIIVELRDRVQ